MASIYPTAMALAGRAGYFQARRQATARAATVLRKELGELMSPQNRRLHYMVALGLLLPGSTVIELARLAESIIEDANLPGSTYALVPGAGFSLVAECTTGGIPDRPWAVSPGPMSNLVKGIINSCTISPAFFPSGPVDSSTRSFGVVQSMPITGQPNRAKALQGWERPVAGPVNAPDALPVVHRPTQDRVYPRLS